MSVFKRIIAIRLIIFLQACGAGTQSLLGNIGSQPNTSGPAVGPALSQTIEQSEQAKQQAANAPTRTLDIVIPTFDAGLDTTTTADHISTEHQMVLAGQHRQQGKQGGMASVHVTDHPVAQRRGLHEINVSRWKSDQQVWCCQNRPRNLRRGLSSTDSWR